MGGGDRPAALRAYRRCCDLLAELGVEPSDRLRRLERSLHQPG
ncbi:MAG: hypothetical protein JJE52_10895 [Acidimicrobiia bacterium]|nr:hypothetical protein [Acidimicrobiia bacterium]